MIRIFTFIIVLLLSSQLSWASKSSDVKKGNRLYDQKKYDEALEKYKSALEKEPESPLINFNAGSALYKRGMYEQSIPYFEKSLLSEDPKFQAKAHYNIGNALYKAGKNAEKSDPDKAAVLLEKAKMHFEKALELNPKDKDAAVNLETAKKELKKVEEKKRSLKKNSMEGEKKDAMEDRDKDLNNYKQDANAKKKLYDEKPGSSNKSIDQSQKNNSSDQGGGTEKDNADQKALMEDKKSQSEDEILKKNAENKNKILKDTDKISSEKKEQMENSKITKPGELSQKEAQMMLDNYNQNEEPKGLMNMQPKGHGETAPVLKDW